MRNFLPLLLLLGACSSAGDTTRKSDAPPILPPFMPPPLGQEAASLSRNLPRPDPVLLAGDLLTIQVFLQKDLDLEVRIPHSGMITYPLIGAVRAAGKTTAALEEVIRQKLDQDYLRDPSVTVTVKEYAKRRVFVVGGVTKPDGYELAPNSRITLLQLIAYAGGYTDRAYKEYVQIVRRLGPEDREVIRLSLKEVEKLVAQGKAEADLELWPDDLVVIPSAVRTAFVLGAVGKPGNVEVPNDARMTVSMAVSNAGSYTKFASTGRVQVLRHTPSGDVRKITVDLDAVLNGQLELDVDLQPGDVVWVPERGIF